MPTSHLQNLRKYDLRGLRATRQRRDAGVPSRERCKCDSGKPAKRDVRLGFEEVGPACVRLDYDQTVSRISHAVTSGTQQHDQETPWSLNQTQPQRQFAACDEQRVRSLALFACLESGRDCKEIVTQLAAASKAVDRAGFQIIASGLRQCLADTENVTTQEDLEKLFMSLA